MKSFVSFLIATTFLVAAHPAKAEFLLQIDENGGGSYFGPNGEPHTWGGFVSLTSPPVYNLAGALGFIPTPGDVAVMENVGAALVLSDLLRFDANGNLTIFSDRESTDVPPFDRADVGVPPLTDTVFVLETNQFGGPAVEGGENGVFGFTPAPGTPGGYPAGTVGTITYDFVSDTPEPSMTAVVAIALLAMVILKRQTQSRRG